VTNPIQLLFLVVEQNISVKVTPRKAVEARRQENVFFVDDNCSDRASRVLGLPGDSDGDLQEVGVPVRDHRDSVRPRHGGRIGEALFSAHGGGMGVQEPPSGEAITKLKEKYFALPHNPREAEGHPLWDA
jgi:hypothetical protein